MAGITWLEGHAAESQAWLEAALDRVKQLPARQARVTEAYVNIYVGWLQLVRGRPAAARATGRMTMDMCESHGLDYFKLVAKTCAEAISEDRIGDPAELHETLSLLDLMGHRAFRAFYLGYMARNYAYLGEVEVAIETAEEALATVEESDERLHEPELLRLMAWLLLRANRDDRGPAGEHLLRGLKLAISQGAVLTAAGIASDLAQLPEADRPDGWREALDAAGSAAVSGN
jgi:hypothetical protein